MEVAFWVCLGIFLYPYVGYPALLFLLNFFRKKRTFCAANNELPSISVIISAYNERAYIDARIKNLLAQNYPAEKLEVLWVVDGSTDGSAEYLRLYYPQMRVLDAPERKGKIKALSWAAQEALHEILIFNDANAFFAPGALRYILEPFQDPQVGVVCGRKTVTPARAPMQGEGLYWRYESFLRREESRFHCTVGCPGEFYALRKSLFPPVRDEDVLDDLSITMRVAVQGKRVVYQPLAVVEEVSSEGFAQEFRRKVRIAVHAWHAFFFNPQWLFFHRHFKLSFQYVSHKVFRWSLAPLALVGMGITSSVLAWQNVFYAVFLGLQVWGYVGVILAYRGLHLPGFWRHVSYGLMMNLAQLWGLVYYLRGERFAKWQKVQRGDKFSVSS
ncbi:MAG: glycosyltransferase family 2 protein [Bacteroidia bacterium]